MNASVIKPIFFGFLVFTLWSTFSCNNPAAIDTTLLDSDLLEIEVDSDFDLTAFTVEVDSVLAYGPGFTILRQYPFGIYEDPIFGTTSATLVSQMYLNEITAPTFTSEIMADSVVMELAINTAEPFYGDTLSIVGLEVFEITETLDAANTFFSSNRVGTEAESIGSYEGVPNIVDSVEVTRFIADTLFTDTFPPLIRFRLDNSYGDRILNAGEDILESPTAFLGMFPGLEIRPTVSNEGLFSFNFNTFNGSISQNINGGNILIYYTLDGVPAQFSIAINRLLSVKFLQYEQDYAGSDVEPFIENELLGDSLLFVQGMTGVNSVVRFNDVDRLAGSLINGATLEVFATALNDDEDIRPLPSQLILQQLEDDGEFELTRDFFSSSIAGDLTIAGGLVEDVGNGIFKYTFDVVGQLQDIIEGEAPNEIFILPVAKIESMRRAVLFGPGHSTYPMKLNVTYTKL